MKADQSLEKYKEAAAWMLLLKNVFVKAFVAADGILTRQEIRPFDKFEEGLVEVNSILDTDMFTYHKDDWDSRVFYGRLSPGSFDTEIDKEVREMAKSYMKDLFEEGA